MLRPGIGTSFFTKEAWLRAASSVRFRAKALNVSSVESLSPKDIEANASTNVKPSVADSPGATLVCFSTSLTKYQS